jgi:tetratricopeptide (TPR) repeat protein
VRAQTRHQLKQDRFAEAVYHQVSLAQEHRKGFIIAAIAGAVCLAAVIGLLWGNSQRNLTASARLGEAQRILETPLTQPGTPPLPGEQSFSTAADRAKAALPKFLNVADQYNWTTSGSIARYYAGICYRDMGNTADAEKELKKTAGSRDKDLSSFSRYALAQLYEAQGRDKDAIASYQDLINKPSDAVSKSTAQLYLAQYYESKQQAAQAKSLYQQIAKDEPKSEAAQFAQSRLSVLK